MAFNAPAVPQTEQRIAQAFGSPTAVEGLAALREALDAPRALRDHGMPEDGIDRAVAPILDAIPTDNPTPVTDRNLTRLLRAAWEGSDPA